MYYQQGDVILKAVDAMSETAIPRSSNIVAEGEATGHAHRINDAELYESPDGTIYVRVPGGSSATLTHEEHAPQTIAPGLYRFTPVREYDHLTEEARRVVD